MKSLWFIVFTLTCPLILISTPKDSATSSHSRETVPSPAPALTYQLANGWQNWDAGIRNRIVTAMDAAIALYNEHGHFPRHLTVNYNPSVPTANGNYNGWINFGGLIGKRVALHEISHTLGIGTHREWQGLIENGQWTGQHGRDQLRKFDGHAATLSADRHHFWPYGLNFDREASQENNRRHVRMVAALRRDLGIADSDLPPHQPSQVAVAPE